MRPVERVLTIFDNQTEQLVAEHPLPDFRLEAFKRQFAVAEDYDPLMCHVYAVSAKDIEFVAQYLDGEVVFDFVRNAYFIECYDAG